MSMLAERRSKQKWSLNPRGKAWSEDSSKFGQKMLEKMGWSKGKGLGAKEDGMLEHVKVSHKCDSKGVGYKESNDQWTAHDSNFNALLASLSGEKPNETETKISSLEKKSQGSKVRVHYKKFTRGKDLSRCSEKDLAQIFGKKSLKETPPQSNEPVEDDEKSDSFSHNKGSMVDYFKRKLPNYGKSNGYVVGSNGVLKKESESEEEFYVGFGFKGDKKRKSLDASQGTPKKMKKEESEEDRKGLSNPAFEPMFSSVEVKRHVLNTIEEESEEGAKKSHNFQSRDELSHSDTSDGKKKKKKKLEKSVEGLDENCQNFEEIEKKIEENKSFDSPGDCQKKKKNAVDNPTFDENCDSDLQNGSMNLNFEVKRKKKNLTILESHNLSFDISSGSNCQNNNSFEVKRKKKKIGTSSLAIDNPNFDSSNQDCQDSYTNETFEVKRKKKKNGESSLAIDNPNFDSSNQDCQDSYTSDNFEVKRKKKKKNGESFLAIDNPNFDSSKQDCQDSYSNEGFEVKRKKKTNESLLAIDNPNFDSSNQNCQDSYTSENFEVKRKKKNKNLGLAIDNPNFDDSTDCQISYTNENFEVKRKTKKKKHDENSSAVDNPTFDDVSVDSCQSIINNFEVKRKKKKNKDFDDSSNKERNKFQLKHDDLTINCSKDSNKEPSFDLISNSKVSIEEPSFDLILNVTSTPSVPKPPPPSKSSTKRRKSVRFSDVNEERIIPNKEDIENRNELFDINSRVIENGLKDSTSTDLDQNIDEISKKIDGFQAEIENDINEAKASRFVGEIGNPEGENEKLPEGTRLKFKYAKFGRSPHYMHRKASKTKSSYKHLIKGDIVLAFNNTNLHEIVGYGVKSPDR